MNIKAAVHNRLMKIQGLLRQVYHKYRVLKTMKIIHQRKPRAQPIGTWFMLVGALVGFS